MADPTLVTNPDLANLITTLNIGVTKIVEFLSHGSTALMTAQGIQLVKKSPNIPWFTDATSGKVKAAVSAGLALLTSLGVSVAFKQMAVHNADGTVSYLVTLGGLTGASIASHVWSLAQQWSLQQGAYVGFIKPLAVTGPPAQAHAEPVQVKVER